jgi:hypothetical protein
MFEPNPAAKSSALASALDHALAQPDFDEEECRLYLKLAFGYDDGPAYTRLLERLEQWGLFGDAVAQSLASEAFFGLRPSVLGHIAKMRPKAVAKIREDGVDLCRGGLALAIAKADKDAAFGLAKAMLGLPQGDQRLRRALSEALELVGANFEHSSNPPSPEEFEVRRQSAHELAAQCERCYIQSSIPESLASKKNPLAL